MTGTLTLWFRSVFYAVLIMVILGGTTRLTGSGLSIVDWRPVTGALPPISESAWVQEFQKYKSSPEFLKKNFDLNLTGFKKIYFWEYTHRLWGRLLGFFLFIPALYFWRKNLLAPWLKWRLLVLILLLGVQGLVGWLMVKSGLTNDPQVSHFRLALHLMLAVLLLSAIRWTEWETKWGRVQKTMPQKSTAFFVFFAIVQLIYGAFLAGTKAGFAFSTFPTMNGEWFPGGALALAPLFLNFLANGIFIHWFHRLLGTCLLFYAWFLWSQNRSVPRLHVAAILSAQYLLGIATVLLHVPIILGVTHQLVAVLFFSTALKLVFLDQKPYLSKS